MDSATATEPHIQSVAANTVDIQTIVEVNGVRIPHSGLVMRLVSSFSGWSVTEVKSMLVRTRYLDRRHNYFAGHQ